MNVHVNEEPMDAPKEHPATLLNYHGACEAPFTLPLRRELLFRSARLYDVYGKLPEGAVPHRDPHDWVDAPTGKLLRLPTVRVWASVRCGKCAKCAYRRYMRYADAAKGWYRTTRLSMFISFTFSNEWFVRRWEKREADLDEATAEAIGRLPGYEQYLDERYSLEASFAEPARGYDANNADHFSAVRQWLGDERKRFLKRFRHSLERKAVFKGVRLWAHCELLELGDLRGRPHLHGLFHVDYEGEDSFEIDGENPDLYLHLREELKRQWHAEGEGVGFLDCKRVNNEHGGDASADYVFKYLLKLVRSNDESKRIAAETRIATSLAYIAKGRQRYADTIEAGDEPAGVEPGPDVTADADLDRALASGGLKGIPDSEVSFEAQLLARKLGQAREAWNLGELWPGFEFEAPVPESEWRWLPPHESDYMGWLWTAFSPDTAAAYYHPEADAEGDDDG